MRSSKQRSRSKSNRPKSLGNIVNRVFDSSGPEGKVRGTPQQIIDKYLVLARDAQLSGDRVAAENFLQHAEHYTRMLSEAQREMSREQDIRRDQLHNGQNRRLDGGDRPGGERGDIDFAAEMGNRDGGQRRQDGREERRDDRSRDDRGREERNREGRGRDDHGRDRPSREEGTPLAAVDPIGDGDSMLVETPESRVHHDDGNDLPLGAPNDEVSDNARPEPAGEERPDADPQAEPVREAAGDERPARQTRSRAPARRAPRKPKPSDSGSDTDGNSSAAAE